MIRSSRIPPLLDRICTDGIVSSLLISKDGELLGSSTNSCNKETIPAQPLTSTKVVTDNVETTDSNDFPSSPLESSSSLLPLPWTKMNPSDVGALIAEIVQDYKRLGCELALLDPTLLPSNGVGGSSNITGTVNNISLPSSNNNDGNDNNNGTTNANPSANVTLGTSNTSSKQQQDKQQQLSNSDTSGVGNDSSNIKDTNNGGNRERGRLNCLIMELDMGLIGIASATSSTYVVALAETTTQHGLLKDKLTVLASLFQESLETVYYA